MGQSISVETLSNVVAYIIRWCHTKVVIRLHMCF